MNFLSADVKISVDDSKLPQQLAKARAAVTTTVGKIKASFSKMATSFKAAWDKIARSAKIAAGIMVAGLLFATRAAMKQADAEFLLAASIKITGDYTKETMKDFKAFATEIQRITIYGDEFVLSLMQQQKSLGVSTDKLEEATKMAIGLATATGRDINSMAMYTAMAMQGEYTMLRRYIPALRTTTDETEQLRIVTEFAARGFELATERAKTASGALRQMWNALGDVAEKLGATLLPSINDFGESLTKAVQKGGAFEEFIKEQVEGLTALVEALEYVNQKIKGTGRNFAKGLGAPITPSKEWYMERPERIPAGIEAYEKAGRVPPAWMWSYRKRAEESTALTEAATEYSEILVEQAEQAEKQVEDMKSSIGAYAQDWVNANALIKDSFTGTYSVIERVVSRTLDSISNTLTDMVMKGKADFKSLANSIVKDITQMIIRAQMAQAIGIMFPALIPAVPTAAQPVYQVASPEGLQHGGTVLKTGWAKVHKGETFSGVGGSKPMRFDFHIHNEGEGDFEITNTEVEPDAEGYIIDIMIKDSLKSGPFSQLQESKFRKN